MFLFFFNVLFHLFLIVLLDFSAVLIRLVFCSMTGSPGGVGKEHVPSICEEKRRRCKCSDTSANLCRFIPVSSACPAGAQHTSLHAERRQMVLLCADKKL